MRFKRRGNQRWSSKFAVAGRGIWRAVRTQASFRVHLVATAGVFGGAMLLDLPAVEFCLLTLCVAGVLAAEIFNTALEQLARAITARPNRRIRDALDMASGAVLVCALGASLVGLMIFVRRLATCVDWSH